VDFNDFSSQGNIVPEVDFWYGGQLGKMMQLEKCNQYIRFTSLKGKRGGVATGIGRGSYMERWKVII
jgi:hypothetical protein